MDKLYSHCCRDVFKLKLVTHPYLLFAIHDDSKPAISCHTRIVRPGTVSKASLNFQPLEVVSSYREPQFQVAENYSEHPAIYFVITLLLLLNNQDIFSLLISVAIAIPISTLIKCRLDFIVY